MWVFPLPTHLPGKVLERLEKGLYMWGVGSKWCLQVLTVAAGPARRGNGEKLRFSPSG